MYFRSKFTDTPAVDVHMDSEKGSIRLSNVDIQVPAKEEMDDTSPSTPPTRTVTATREHHDEFLLPTPVVAHSGSSRSKAKKSAHIEKGLKVHWAQIKKLIYNTSDGPTESGLEVLETTEGSSWDRSHAENAHHSEDRDGRGVDSNDRASLDEVVLDRTWYASDHERTSSAQSEFGASPEKSGSNPLGTSTDRESLLLHSDGCWGLITVFTFIRWRLLPWLVQFFAPRDFDPKAEAHYQKETWYTSKPLAIWSSLFFVLNWVLGCALVPRPFVLADNIFYFAIALIFTVPLPIMVLFNFPRDRPWLYQSYLTFSTWIWTWYQLIFIYACGFYNPAHRHFSCGSKDFLATFYYATGLQTIAVFGLKLNRFPAMIGALISVVFIAVLVIPDRTGWVRNLVNFIVFQAFLLYIHFMRENAERRLYNLRDQLKTQFRATQKAQVNERKAADSKRRLTSYVFHDKVPLNTALIAVQNMEATNQIEPDQDVEFKALEGSLSMMSKVLNDVLDFNRMDSGRFESVSRPYQFHKVMKSMFVPLRLATDARGLELVTDLDKTIDWVARRAAFVALGEDESEFDKILSESADDDGMVVGDEMRLRQVVTNLASNACKFTQTGGKLTISTRLIIPNASILETRDRKADVEQSDGVGDEKTVGLSAQLLNQHNQQHSKSPPLEGIVVRIEVSDTGFGIQKKDMQRGKLFTAFTQTEQGRQQGGKGTGLGLALVRQIVKLSGGRLGVRSKIGEGSTFWVELPLGVGEKAVCQPADAFDQELRSEQILGRSPPRMAGEQARSPHPHFQGPCASSSSDSGTSTLVDGSRNNSYGHVPSPQTSSALKTIMEQGGLVELAPHNRRDVDGPLPTRMLGDASTGTAATMNDTQTSPTIEQNGTQSPQSNGKAPRRPTYVELPEPTFASARLSPSLSQGAGSPGKSVPPTPKSDLSHETPLRVLVVDDDPLTRKLMRRMMMRLGCNVSTAENGAVAYELITTDQATPATEMTHAANADAFAAARTMAPSYDGPRYEVVFLDNQMPVMSGIALVAKLRSELRSDFVVGVTGNALLTDQQEYLDAGVDYVITKPVFEASLKNMLGIAAERRKRRSRTEVPT